MTLIKEMHSTHWENSFSPESQLAAIQALEGGQILLLPQLPFLLLKEEQKFLTPSLSDMKCKNISFNIQNDSLKGFHKQNSDHEKLKAMMKRYAKCSENLIMQLFPRYQQKILWGRTSFRPVEVFGRIAQSYRKDDTRLHVDAFPTSPTQGKRIVRVFTNINPNGKERLWKVGEPFNAVADRFLPQLKRPWFGRGALLKALRITKSYCTEYDYLMLQIHNNMKKDLSYQQSVAQQEIRFWPGSTWVVQTDDVSHAALSGQYVLEQTFYLPVDAMANPSLSPLKILENKTRRTLI